MFDVGRHGYLNGGHAHADALAITLNVGYRPLLVDPGTSTYTDRTRRDQMRGSSSHNTVTIDGRPQSIPDGPFGWRTRSDARLHAWRHNPAFDWAEASHDGYAPLQHRRTLLRTSSGWLIVDEVLGRGPHTTQTFWHFDPAWAVTIDRPGQIRATDADGGVAWLVHDSGAATLERGNERLGFGWHAPVYGTRVPAWVAEVRSDGTAPFDAVTWIGEAADGTRPLLERLHPPADPADRTIAARVTTGEHTAVLLVRPGGPALREARETELPDYQSNARVLHYASRAGTLVALDLVDGTHAVTNRDGWLSIAADGLIAELHIGLDGGTMDLQAFNPPSRLQLKGNAIPGLRRIRLNGRDWWANEPGRCHSPLVIDACQWAADSDSWSAQPDLAVASTTGIPLAPLTNHA